MLDDVKVGELLAKLAEVETGQDRCEEQNEEIKAEVKGLRADFVRMSTDLEELAKEQKADNETRSNMATAMKVVRIVATIATVILLPVAGWLGKEAWEHYFVTVERIDTVEEEASHNHSEVNRHVASIGHEPTRAAVQQNREAIGQINVRLDTISTEQTTIRETQSTILREVRRTRRYGE